MTIYPQLLSKTGEELRQMAADCHKRSSDSFDRCDTDGFLSQWANDVTGNLYRLAADLADAGWTKELSALFDLDGNLLDAELKSGKFGLSWMIRNGDGTVRWVSCSRAASAAKRRAHYERKGVREGTVARRVVPVMAEGGPFGCYPSFIVDRDYADEVEIVSTDDPGTDDEPVQAMVAGQDF